MPTPNPVQDRSQRNSRLSKAINMAVARACLTEAIDRALLADMDTRHRRHPSMEAILMQDKSLFPPTEYQRPIVQEDEEGDDDQAKASRAFISAIDACFDASLNSDHIESMFWVRNSRWFHENNRPMERYEASDCWFFRNWDRLMPLGKPIGTVISHTGFAECTECGLYDAHWDWCSALSVYDKPRSDRSPP